MLEIAPRLDDQVTAVLVEPVTVALNCCVPPELIVPLVGDTEIDTRVPEALTWKIWLADPLQVFCSMAAPEEVAAPTMSTQPLLMFPERIL